MLGEAIAPVVQAWAEAGGAVVVWDGAPGHRGPYDRAVTVERMTQPPDSPQRNPAEQVCEYLRDKIEGLVDGSLDAKKRPSKRS
jgi:hypothetical protein